MKTEDFIFAINEIEDEYITEPFEENKMAKKISFKKWFALAACFVFVVFTAIVVTAKPEYELNFEETEFEGEKAYFVTAELEKFPLEKFSRNTKEIRKEIIRQYRDYEPYMSSTPGYWYKYYDTFEEAKNFIGFPKFEIIELDIPKLDACISAFGDETGTIIRIGGQFAYQETVGGFLGLQIFTVALTEYYEEDFVWHEFCESAEKYKNEKGTEFYIIENGKSETENTMKGIYFIKNGVLYYCHFAFSEEKSEKAEDIVQKVLNFY